MYRRFHYQLRTRSFFINEYFQRRKPEQYIRDLSFILQHKQFNAIVFFLVCIFVLKLSANKCSNFQLFSWQDKRTVEKAYIDFLFRSKQILLLISKNGSAGLHGLLYVKL